MKLKKLMTIGLSLMLSLGVVACNNNGKNANENTKGTKVETPTGDNTSVRDNDYVTQYSRFYGDYMNDLNNYKVYLSPQSVSKYYETNEYPGNEKYLSNVKEAYKDARDKTQAFVNNLKNDVKTDDKELDKMNKDLIREGEKTIANIDTKLKNLNKISKEDLSKSKEDFMRVVDEATKTDKGEKNQFEKLLEDMNRSLGIDTSKYNNTNNNNTNNNNNNNNNNNINKNDNVKK